MATIKKPAAKKAQNGVTQVTTKYGSMGYDPNTNKRDKTKTKRTEKLNSEGDIYISKEKSIGYEIDKNNKPTNPTISKYKTDSFGKEIKRTTNPVSMGRAKRNVRRKLGSDAPEAMKKGGVVKAQNGIITKRLGKNGEDTLEMTSEYAKKLEYSKKKNELMNKFKKAKTELDTKPKKKAKSGGSFPDLNKDGKVTKKDVLIGRGVIKAKKGASIRKAGLGDMLGKVAGSGAFGLAGMAANKLFGGKKKEAAPAMASPAMKKGGKIAAKAMKSGGKMAKCKYGCK
jgi:hypothetical protein